MWPMVIMLAGSAIQGAGGAFGASQALKQSKYQQDILRYQEDYVKAAAEIGVEKVKRNVGQVKSAQRAATDQMPITLRPCLTTTLSRTGMS